MAFRYRQHKTGSMLAATQRRRSDVYRYIVHKHRETIARSLEDVLTRKDALFFEQLQAVGYYEARFGWAVALIARVRRLLGLGGPAERGGE